MELRGRIAFGAVCAGTGFALGCVLTFLVLYSSAGGRAKPVQRAVASTPAESPAAHPSASGESTDPTAHAIEIDTPPVYLQRGNGVLLCEGDGAGAYKDSDACREAKEALKDERYGSRIAADVLGHATKYMYHDIAGDFADHDGLQWHRVGKITYKRSEASDLVIGEYSLDVFGKGEHFVAVWEIAKTKEAIRLVLPNINLAELAAVDWSGCYLVKVRPWVSVNDWNANKPINYKASSYVLWVPEKK